MAEAAHYSVPNAVEGEDALAESRLDAVPYGYLNVFYLGEH